MLVVNSQVLDVKAAGLIASRLEDLFGGICFFLASAPQVPMLLASVLPLLQLLVSVLPVLQLLASLLPVSRAVSCSCSMERTVNVRT